MTSKSNKDPFEPIPKLCSDPRALFYPKHAQDGVVMPSDEFFDSLVDKAAQLMLPVFKKQGISEWPPCTSISVKTYLLVSVLGSFQILNQ